MQLSHILTGVVLQSLTLPSLEFQMQSQEIIYLDDIESWSFIDTIDNEFASDILPVLLADPKWFRCQCATLVSGSSRAAWLMQMKRLCKRPCVNWKKSSRWRPLWQRCGWMTFCSCVKTCQNIPEKEQKRCLQRNMTEPFIAFHFSISIHHRYYWL